MQIDIESVYANIEKLGDGMKELPDTKEARADRDTYFESRGFFGTTFKEREEVEQRLSAVEYYTEKQGFICGFKTAVQLLCAGLDRVNGGGAGMIANMYMLTHGKEYANYDELSRWFDLIEREYSFSNHHFWMWKAFQFGVENGKRIERQRQKKRRAAGL